MGWINKIYLSRSSSRNVAKTNKFNGGYEKNIQFYAEWAYRSSPVEMKFLAKRKILVSRMIPSVLKPPAPIFAKY